MTVIEKLKFDKNVLSKQFGAWIDGPGKVDYCSDSHVSVVSRYDSLRGAYLSENYNVFLDWAFAEYHEFEDCQICPDGTVIVDAKIKDPMKVKAFNIFSTGWRYHLDCLKRDKKDLSKPFADSRYFNAIFRQAIPNIWTDENEKELIRRIDVCLDEHDPASKNPCHINVYYGLTDKEKQFYIEYDTVLRSVKAAILNKTYKLDKNYINEILNRKKSK